MTPWSKTNFFAVVVSIIFVLGIGRVSAANTPTSVSVAIGGISADLDSNFHLLGTPGATQSFICGPIVKDAPKAQAECRMSGPTYAWTASSTGSTATFPGGSTTPAVTLKIVLGSSMPQVVHLSVTATWTETSLVAGTAPRGAIPISTAVDIYFDAIQLYSITFQGTNNIALQNAANFTSNGTGDVRVPQFLAMQKNSEICYIWECSPELKVTLKVPSGVAARTAKVKGVATQAGSTNTFEYNGTFSLPIGGTSGGQDVQTLTTSGKLLKQIDNTTLDIHWTISYDDGVHYSVLGTTSNPLFVVTDNPVSTLVSTVNVNRATVKRMDAATKLAKGKITAVDVADIVGPDAVGGSRFNSHNSIYLYMKTAWTVLDGTKADCVTLAMLMKYELNLLGFDGAEVKVVCACHASWTQLVQDPGTFTLEQNAGKNLNFWFAGGLGAGYNKFEGCCVFKTKWWEGGNGVRVDSAFLVWKDVVKDNLDGLNNSHQTWVGTPSVHVDKPAGTP